MAVDCAAIWQALNPRQLLKTIYEEDQAREAAQRAAGARTTRTMIGVTVRRALGTGPEAPAHSIRAAQADLLDELPGVRLPDLDELRARGVLGAHPATSASPRRTLGAGGRANGESPDLLG
ncbi:hypothetical protein [Streptomyces sp. NPDC003480]